MEVLFSKMYPNFGLILLLMIDSTYDQKDIAWLDFISSTYLVMSIIALLFRWREEPMIIFSGNCKRQFQQNLSTSYVTISNSMYPLSVEYIKCTEMAMIEFCYSF